MSLWFLCQSHLRRSTILPPMNKQLISKALDRIEAICDQALFEGRDLTPTENAAIECQKQTVEAAKAAKETRMSEPTATYTPVPPAAPAIHNAEHRPYSITRAVAGLMRIPGAADDGFEREVGDEMARRAPGKTWNGAPVPFKALFPSLAKANAGAAGGTGNPLTGTAYMDELLSIQDGAMPKEMLAGRAGGRSFATSELVAQLPIVDGKVTAATVALDADIALSDFATDNVTLSPVTAGARTQIKRSLFYSHHPDAEGILRAQIAAAVAEELDKVWLGPTGGAPQPSGLLDLATTATPAAVPNTEAGWRVFRDELLAYIAMPDPDMSVKFILPTLLDDVLAVTPRYTNAYASVSNDGMIAGTLAMRTTLLDVTTITAVPVLVGDFAQMITVLFNQGGADVVANPYVTGSWEHGGFELRALIDYNVHLLDPKRILQATANATPA